MPTRPWSRRTAPCSAIDARSRSIHIEAPDSGERRRFIRSNYRSFYGAEAEREVPDDLAGLLSALTDGFTYYEMLSLIGLSRCEAIPVTRIGSLCEHFKYGIVERHWDKLDQARLARAGELMRAHQGPGGGPRPPAGDCQARQARARCRQR